MKASDVINRSLRLLGIIAAGETATAEDSADCLEALNDLLASWNVRMNHGQGAIASKDDDLLLGNDYKAVLAYNLAVEMAPEYGVAVRPDIYERADQLRRNMGNDFADFNEAFMDHLPGGQNRYNINSDE